MIIGINQKETSKKPFLLISSNMGLTDYTSWFERVKFMREAGYVERDPDTYKKDAL